MAKKYYDWEMDQVLTEKTAKEHWERMQEWCRKHGFKEEPFEEFVSANYYDLQNKIENASAQAYHDRLGTATPVKPWRTLMRNAI